jgi:hypothetical protein
MNPPNTEWVGVDFDGTLAIYRDGMGPTELGEPLAPMVARVKAWLADGIDVQIVTARVADSAWNRNRRKQVDAALAIEKWCYVHLGVGLKVRADKDQYMRELWDDRARQVEYNTGDDSINAAVEKAYQMGYDHGLKDA